MSSIDDRDELVQPQYQESPPLLLESNDDVGPPEIIVLAQGSSSSARPPLEVYTVDDVLKWLVNPRTERRLSVNVGRFSQTPVDLQTIKKAHDLSRNPETGRPNWAVKAEINDTEILEIMNELEKALTAMEFNFDNMTLIVNTWATLIHDVPELELPFMNLLWHISGDNSQRAKALALQLSVYLDDSLFSETELKNFLNYGSSEVAFSALLAMEHGTKKTGIKNLEAYLCSFDKPSLHVAAARILKSRTKDKKYDAEILALLWLNTQLNLNNSPPKITTQHPPTLLQQQTLLALEEIFIPHPLEDSINSSAKDFDGINHVRLKLKEKGQSYEYEKLLVQWRDILGQLHHEIRSAYNKEIKSKILSVAQVDEKYLPLKTFTDRLERVHDAICDELARGTSSSTLFFPSSSQELDHFPKPSSAKIPLTLVPVSDTSGLIHTPRVHRSINFITDIMRRYLRRRELKSWRTRIHSYQDIKDFPVRDFSISFLRSSPDRNVIGTIISENENLRIIEVRKKIADRLLKLYSKPWLESFNSEARQAALDIMFPGCAQRSIFSGINLKKKKMADRFIFGAIFLKELNPQEILNPKDKANYDSLVKALSIKDIFLYLESCFSKTEKQQGPYKNFRLKTSQLLYFFKWLWHLKPAFIHDALTTQHDYDIFRGLVEKTIQIVVKDEKRVHDLSYLFEVSCRYLKKDDGASFLHQIAHMQTHFMNKSSSVSSLSNWLKSCEKIADKTDIDLAHHGRELHSAVSQTPQSSIHRLQVNSHRFKWAMKKHLSLSRR